jgi:retron-type reverse transcriptase
MTGSLYAQVCDWDNLLLAHRKASKGKRGNDPAARFEYRLEDNLVALQDELRTQTYRPGPYNSFYIHEPKRRLISAAPFRDRVVHHALCNVIEPIFERSRLSGCRECQATTVGWPRLESRRGPFLAAP